MSDMPVETGTANEVAPEVTNDVGTSESEAAQPSYLDTDQYRDHHIRVKVDGQEVSVPLSEAMDGYSRQADYTRKTQELSELQRQAQFGMTLQQALEANPAETLRILQAQYAAEQDQGTPAPTPDPDLSPEAARWQEMEARVAKFEQAQADNDLRAAVGFLQQRYGDDFNPQEVVQAAFQQGRMDLEGVYKEMAFDRYWKGQQAAREQQAQDEQARLQAKDQTANVHTGNGAANTAVPSTDSFLTIEEAFAAAKRTHGVL